MTTPSEAGDAISAFLANVEQQANDNVDAVRDLAPAFEAISELGGVSTLETVAFKGELETIVSDFRAKLYRWHSDAFKRTEALGIDQVFPTPRGGGGR